MLNDVKARHAKPRDKDYKLADSGGLYLFVTRTGFKSWRMKYRFAGKEKRLTFGAYPEVPLAEARERRDSARRLLRDHRDPKVEMLRRRAAAYADHEATFEAIARKWHATQEARWTPIHAADVLRSLERDVFPALGSLPIREVDVPLVLATLRLVEARGSLETAKRLRQRISAVFVQAISEGICTADPAAVVTKALQPKRKRTRQPAITSIDELRKLLNAAEASGASPVTKVASRLLALTAVRPGVLRGVRWDEFEGIDWDDPEFLPNQSPVWRIPAKRMKLALDRKDEETFEHLVPLSRQAVEALRAIRPLTARMNYVFPSARHAHWPMSENALGYLYNRVGYHGRHVPHGWRAAFSTIMNEQAERAGRPGDRAIVDLMLAHVPPNTVEGAYNRAAYWDRRCEIAQEWADLVTEGLAPASDLLAWPRR
jgi:integrase